MKKDPRITFPRTLTNDIFQQAQRDPSVEICGLIAAKQGIASRCYPIANISEQPQTRYSMDPTGQIKALRDMRDHDEELFAIYHSHPNSPAKPSATDINEAYYPDTLYLIISLKTKGIVELRGFYIRDGQSQEVELEIE